MNTAQNNKEKRFINRPEFPGGKKALLAFIDKNLEYPKDAIEQKIEGSVGVIYEVNDNGIVESAKVNKKLFPSCDEEAIRLVMLLRYNRPKNIGIRVKSSFKITIHFRLTAAENGNVINFQYTHSDNKPTKKTEEKSENYSYTITF